MEYVFGTEHRGGIDAEVVKVVSESGTDLSGNFTIERHFTDNVITDSFTILEKIRHKETTEAQFDWYTIANHKTIHDKFSPKEEKINGDIAVTQDGLMETYEAVDANKSDISLCNDAIMELYELINGGN